MTGSRIAPRRRLLKRREGDRDALAGQDPRRLDGRRSWCLERALSFTEPVTGAIVFPVLRTVSVSAFFEPVPDTFAAPAFNP